MADNKFASETKPQSFTVRPIDPSRSILPKAYVPAVPQSPTLPRPRISRNEPKSTPDTKAKSQIPKTTLKTRQVQAVPSSSIQTAIQAVKSDIAAVRNAWAKYRTTNSRDAIYVYLSAVFQTVMRWKQKNQSKRNARLALKLHPNHIALKMEPFTVVIFCTSDRKKVDGKTRSKWSRVLRVVAKRKKLEQSVKDFIKDQGGINNCAALFSALTK